MINGLATSPADAPSIVMLAILACTMTVAVYIELKERRIPNWLTLSGMAAGLLIGYARGPVCFRSSLAGLIIGFGFLFIFYVFGGIGGGDVKLMGVAGALLGSGLVASALFYTAIVGAFMAVMIVVWNRDVLIRLKRGMTSILRRRKPEHDLPTTTGPATVPYGVAIAAGCVLALWLKNG